MRRVPALLFAYLCIAVAPGALQFQETHVAGGRGDVMVVEHLRLRGTNPEIGAKLAELARGLHVAKTPRGDAATVAAQRRYFQLNYPIHLARMQGAAAVFGASPENPRLDFSCLLYNTGLPGCSVVYYPPRYDALGHGVLSRNFDFTTGSLLKTEPNALMPRVAAQPFVIEMYPDQGYPSLYICLFDLLSGAVDGINSQGLTVAMLADDETPAKYGVQPLYQSAVGLNEVQIIRFLLDSCADCQEARAALLGIKHYYGLVPCHYLVADRSGRSFVWEYSAGGNREYFIDGGGKPQAATNFMLHRYPSPADVPKGNPPGMYGRYRILCEGFSDKASLTRQQMKQSNYRAAVVAETYARPGSLHRTLWHALYDVQACSLSVDFNLGEEKDPGHPGKLRTRRSGYKDFQLTP